MVEILTSLGSYEKLIIQKTLGNKFNYLLWVSFILRVT